VAAGTFVHRYSVAVTLAAFTALLSRSAIAAQPSAGNPAMYPAKPIRLIVAQPPGGSTDITMRLFAQKVGESLGQQMVVDNRASGGVGSVATLTTVARANPDGYTLLAVTPSFTFAPALVKNMTVDPLKDFAAVTQLTRAPYLLVGFGGSPIKSVRELIAYAKAQPGKLYLGATNIGSGTHLVAMRFLTEAGIRTETTYVPYKGVAAALLDLMSGRIDISVAGIVSAIPLLKTGRLRALGMSSAKRSALLPDLPTLAEQGLPGYEAWAFEGWAAPAKTPVATLNVLSAEAAKAARAASIADKYRDDGAEALGSSPEAFQRFIAQEVPQWRKLVKELGISVDAE
jgi:tripartite-type tricarboxylate transporter receptor subunit TctC